MGSPLFCPSSTPSVYHCYGDGLLYIFLVRVHLISWTNWVKVPREQAPASAAFPRICRVSDLHPSEQPNILFSWRHGRARELPFTIALRMINPVPRRAASSKKAKSRSMAQALRVRQ